MNENWTEEQKRLYGIYDQAITDLVEFAAPKAPALGNKGTAQVVDMTGRLNELRKGADKIEKLLKGVIETKVPETEKEVRGEAYVMCIETGISTTRLNQDVAKSLLQDFGNLHAKLKALNDPAVDALIKIYPSDPLGNAMQMSEGSRRTFKRIGG